jgi:hypothetical protein
VKNSSNEHVDVSIPVATVNPGCFPTADVKPHVTIGHCSKGLFMLVATVKTCHVATMQICSSLH